MNALLDLDGALEFLDGDAELCERLMCSLVAMLDEAGAELPVLVATRDWIGVGDLVHRIGPSVALFSERAAAPITALHAAARDGDVRECKRLADLAQPLLAGLADAIRRRG